MCITSGIDETDNIFFSVVGTGSVSTKHLQQYLDWFVFSKYQTYKVEYPEQVENFKKNTLIYSTYILFNNVCNNYSIFDFYSVYSDYSYPSNSIT